MSRSCIDYGRDDAAVSFFIRWINMGYEEWVSFTEYAVQVQD